MMLRYNKTRLLGIKQPMDLSKNEILIKYRGPLLRQEQINVTLKILNTTQVNEELFQRNMCVAQEDCGVW